MGDLHKDAATGYALQAAMARGDVTIKLGAGGRWRVSIRGDIGREQVSVGHFKTVRGIVGRGAGFDLTSALHDAAHGKGLNAQEIGGGRG